MNLHSLIAVLSIVHFAMGLTLLQKLQSHNRKFNVPAGSGVLLLSSSDNSVEENGSVDIRSGKWSSNIRTKHHGEDDKSIDEEKSSHKRLPKEPKHLKGNNYRSLLKPSTVKPLIQTWKLQRNQVLRPFQQSQLNRYAQNGEFRTVNKKETQENIGWNTNSKLPVKPNNMLLADNKCKDTDANGYCIMEEYD